MAREEQKPERGKSSTIHSLTKIAPPALADVYLGERVHRLLDDARGLPSTPVSMLAFRRAEENQTSLWRDSSM